MTALYLPPRDDYPTQDWMHPSMQSPVHWVGLPQGNPHVRNGHIVVRSDSARAIPYPQEEPVTDRNQQRATRAQQACVNCRQKKTKCNELRPRCSQCEMTDSECLYNSENIPTKRQLSFMDVTDRLERIETVQNSYLRVMSLVEGMLRNFEKIVAGSDSMTSTSASSLSTEQPTVHRNGTIPAHKLALHWPAMRPFYRTVGGKDYVTVGEHGRTTLAQMLRDQRNRLRLRYPSNANLPTLSSHGVAVTAVNDTDSISTASSGLCGDSFASASSTATSPCYDTLTFGDFSQPSTLSLTVIEAKAVFDEYIHKVHILHPFIDAPRIENAVNSFVVADRPLESVPMQRDFSSSSDRSFAPRRKLKRRLNEAFPTPAPTHPNNQQSHPMGPADTAVALLVIALGKVNGEIAHPLRETAKPGISRAAPTVAPDIFSPYYMTDGFLNSMDQSSSFYNGQMTPAHSFDRFDMKDPVGVTHFCGSSSAPEHSAPLDPATPPGFAFYTHATQILGELFGEGDLTYVHALLLAGLYCSSLVRPLESFHWVNTAATTMQTILNLNRHCMSADRTDDRTDSIRLTYWTCLQLESDILAELDLPQSGLSRFEGQVPPPKGPLHHGSLYNFNCEEVMWFYSMQIWLRRLLNQTHAVLYDATGNLSPLGAKSLMDALESWRHDLARHDFSLAWNDEQAPATEINAARMRGKYYGACYLINRPSLHRAMSYLEKSSKTKINISQDSKWHTLQTIPSVRDWEEVSNSDAAEIATVLGIDQDLMDACRQCVNAAVRNTEAFDGLPTMPERLPVTDVFGTAQSQFGNMLVLSAVARSQYLFWLIPGQTFKRLLNRTMTFVGNLAPHSPTMATNLDVLREIERLTIANAAPHDDIADSVLDLDASLG